MTCLNSKLIREQFILTFFNVVITQKSKCILMVRITFHSLKIFQLSTD